MPNTIGVSSATASVTSGSEGTFSLRLPPGAYRLVYSELIGYLNTAETGEENAVQVDVKEGATVPITFHLARALGISGVARDKNGKPVPGVEITVMGQGNVPKATTDAEGKWTLKNLKPGNLRLVPANDYEFLSGNEVTLTAKEAAASVILTVKPFKAVPVTGQVVAQGGKPIAGVMIQSLTKMMMGGGVYWLNVQESRTDDQGRFTLPTVRPENPEVELKFNKPGYKLASGGTLARQGDIFVITAAVLRSLDQGRTLKGRVVDAVGKPAVNALVAVAGADTVGGGTRTDALGRFTLRGVPEEGRLLAARGASFGAASLTASTTSVVLRIAPLRTAVIRPKEDRNRAVSILLEIRKRTAAAKGADPGRDNPIGDNLAWQIAPLDFPLALQLAQKDDTTTISAQTLSGMIIEAAQKNPLRIREWAMPVLKNITDAPLRCDSLYAIVLASPGGADSRALTLQLYKEMQALPVSSDGYWAKQRLTRLAVLAALLNLPDESQSWMNKALAIDGGAQGVAFEAVPGGLTFLRRVLPLVEAKDRSDTYMRVIAKLSRISARSALALLQDMEKDTALKESRDEYNRGVAVLEVIRALAPQDPAAATALAERIPYRDFQSAAWALAAHGQSTPAKAAPLYERAVNSGMAGGSPDQMARIASIAYETDPKLGKALFARAKQKLDELSTSKENYRLSTTLGFAHFYALAAPGESRLLLEVAAARFQTADIIREDKFGNARAMLALALRPFSIERALQVSETLPERQEGHDYDIRNDIQAKIACWLLTDEAKRRKLPLGSYDQFGFEPRDY